MSEIPLETRKKMGINTAKTHFENDLIPMLERAYNKRITEFRLVVTGGNNGADHFYIHPMNVSGETVDIDWKPADSFLKEIDVNQ
jgi:hypothetical protein